MIARRGVMVWGGVVVVAGRSKTITGKITQLLHCGVGGGQRQIVSRNAFHDYCGTNVSTNTHTPKGLPTDTVTLTYIRKHAKRQPLAKAKKNREVFHVKCFPPL